MIRLSSKQSQVADYLLEGKTSKEIANELGIQHSTVRTHIHGMYQKFGVADRNALLLAIMRNKTGAAAGLLHQRYPSITIQKWERIIDEVITALEIS